MLCSSFDALVIIMLGTVLMLTSEVELTQVLQYSRPRRCCFSGEKYSSAER